jgi:HAD superfamily hydrolase (TIGR01549 family)
MLKAITFDFWNTLMADVHGREREALRARLVHDELRALGRDLSPLLVDEALRTSFDYFDRIWMSEHRTPPCAELVDAMCVPLGPPALPAEVRARIALAFEELVLQLPPEPTPGAVFTLPMLAERYRLAVICDTGYSPGRILRQVLERYDMLHYFDYLYFSDEHGMSKPDVRVFRHTLDELGVRAPEAAHVGDIQRTDIAGAQAAGMAAVHFVGVNNHDATRSTADLVVRHFEELPDLLGGFMCPGC